MDSCDDPEHMVPTWKGDADDPVVETFFVVRAIGRGGGFILDPVLRVYLGHDPECLDDHVCVRRAIVDVDFEPSPEFSALFVEDNSNWTSFVFECLAGTECAASPGRVFRRRVWDLDAADENGMVDDLDQAERDALAGSRGVRAVATGQFAIRRGKCSECGGTSGPLVARA